METDFPPLPKCSCCNRPDELATWEARKLVTPMGDLYICGHCKELPYGVQILPALLRKAWAQARDDMRNTPDTCANKHQYGVFTGQRAAFKAVGAAVEALLRGETVDSIWDR